MTSRSYVIGIIKILANSSRVGLGLLPKQIFDKLVEIRSTWRFTDDRARGVKIVAGALEELLTLGVVAVEKDGAWRLSHPIIVDLVAPPPDGLDTSGGGLGGPPDNGAPESDGQGPGGGVGEILAHEFLFSIDETAFEAALDRALAEY